MKPTRLILIPGLASEPAPYLVIDGGGVRERGLLELDAVERPEPMRTVAVAPGADVAVRWLDLPAGGAAQQRAAALWMLKDALAAPADRLCRSAGPGSRRGAAAVWSPWSACRCFRPGATIWTPWACGPTPSSRTP